MIRRMSIENPLWGAPRIHGELLKLGYEVAQSSVAKHMVKRRALPRVANAINDAIGVLGAKVTATPVTPQRILQALGKIDKGAMTPRLRPGPGGYGKL